MRSFLCAVRQPSLKFNYFVLNAVFILLVSCSQYEFAVNDKTIYTPADFRKNLQLDDEPLLACIKTQLLEERITKAEQTLRIQCGPGSIQSLSGIEIFSHLQLLGLANNQLNDISPIRSLRDLSHLNLENNDVRNAGVLGNLPSLLYVNLKGNNNLNCTSLEQLKQKKGVQLLQPEHCH